MLSTIGQLLFEPKNPWTLWLRIYRYPLPGIIIQRSYWMLFIFSILFIAALSHLCSLWPQRNASDQWHTHSLSLSLSTHTHTILVLLLLITIICFFTFVLQIPDHYFMIETIPLDKIKMFSLMQCIKIIIRFPLSIYDFSIKNSFDLKLDNFIIFFVYFP